MRKLGKVNKIIIHHTAGNDTADVKAIRRQHINKNRWSDIGYHFLIHRIPMQKEFVTSAGRSTNFEGAHTRGANSNSIGVSVAGNYQRNQLPIEARKELIATLKKLVKEYKLKANQISYHQKESPSLCPGKYIIADFKNIVNDVFKTSQDVAVNEKKESENNEAV